MANFKGHFCTAATLGVGYGCWGALQLQLGWPAAVLGGGLTTLGGLLPDLDSDSGVPVRELFNLSGTLAPVLLLPRLEAAGLTTDQMILAVAGIYLLVRFGAATAFKHLTAHRGMFHSVPGMGIAGLAVFLLYHNPDLGRRLYLAGGTMLGFLSHLVLDELFAVDLMGLKPRLNKYAGSALKFWSQSWTATLLTYAVLAVLAVPAWLLWTAQQAR